jgi:hypothetical protein
MSGDQLDRQEMDPVEEEQFLQASACSRCGRRHPAMS